MSPIEEDLLVEQEVTFHVNKIIVKFSASQQKK